ncbi:MAG: hypothetical protein ACYDG3_07010 [Bacillati bacterium]
MATTYAQVSDEPLKATLEPTLSVTISERGGVSINVVPDEPDFERFTALNALHVQETQRQLELERQRQATETAIAEATARGRAHTETWWVRLDPDLEPSDLRSRRSMASALASIRAPWTIKLVQLALAQEEEDSVRARLLGTLYRLGITEDLTPFALAAQRSDIERAAVEELFGSPLPFADSPIANAHQS